MFRRLSMKHWLQRGSLIFFQILVFAGIFLLEAGDRLRLEGVLYVDDFLSQPVVLEVLRPTSLSFSRNGDGLIDNLRSHQSVRVIGLAEERYLVGTRLANGPAEGWVLASEVESIPQTIIKEIQEKSAEAEKLKQAIARGEIEIGMPEEAVAKILGKAKAKSQISEAGGTFEQWTYTTYKTVPFYVPTQFNGTNYVSTFYRKVPVGTKIVTFQNKKVIRFETKQDDMTPYQGGQTLIPPVYVP